jgi:hypothetical protein
VCFDCRTTERVPISRLTRDCRKCHAPAEHVYYKFRIPARDDDKAWSELKWRVREVNDRIKAGALRHLRAESDRYLRMLRSAPTKRLKSLQRRLRQIDEKLRKWERWP